LTRFCSIFNQFAPAFSARGVQKAVMTHGRSGTARGFLCWNQFVAMLFRATGARAFAARDLRGLASARASWRISARPPPAVDARLRQCHRPWQLYQAVFYQVLARCREVTGSKPFRFKNRC